jgi:predicted amidophosphoribosyltransferase
MKLRKHKISTDKIIIYYLNDYIPKGYNVEQDEFSKRIIQFKDHDKKALYYFYDLIETKITIGQKFMVCYVPSSRIQTTWTACRELACKIRQNKKLKMGEHILNRRVPLRAQHISRNSKKDHYNSLNLEKSFISEIEGQHILLFDDVITTGNSFISCAQLLLDNGAKKITGVILGSTKWLYK